MTITVEDFLKELAQVELSNLAIATEAEQGSAIERANRAAVVTCINDGLTEMYSQMVLKKGTVLIHPMAGIKEYRVSKIHALAYKGSDQSDFKYLIDSEEDPFNDDLVKITDVYGSTTGEKLINATGSKNGVELLAPDTFRVYGKLDAGLLVKYQALHPKVVESCRSIQTPEGDQIFVGYLSNNIELPTFLLPALKNYVGYKMYARMNTQEASVLSNKFYALYQEILRDVYSSNKTNESQISVAPNLFNDRGWV